MSSFHFANKLHQKSPSLLEAEITIQSLMANYCNQGSIGAKFKQKITPFKNRWTKGPKRAILCGVCLK